MIYVSSTVIQIIQIVYFLTVAGVVVVLISENRNPIKSVAWIMAVVFLPVVGIVWYAIFGQDLTKRRIISKRTYSKLKKRPLDEMQIPAQVAVPEEHSDLINLIQKMDYNPLLGGNDVKIFTSGKEKFEHLLADISRAKKHIHVEYYVLSDDEIGRCLQDALIRKAKEGLEIRIIYDSFGSRKSDKKYYEHFRMAGIETEPFLKLTFPRLTSHINFRNHRKMVIIDGQIGYTGGMNVADRYINGFEWGSWRDTHARIEGKGVQGLQSVFLLDWYFVSQTLITSRKYFPMLDDFGNKTMQIVSSGPMRAVKEIPAAILQAIYDARKSIFIQTPYFLPTEMMIEALQIAATRGVDVRLMMSERSDMLFVQMASYSYVKQMLESGIKVYFYKKGFLHSKLMLFDDSLTLIGSANFDVRSFEQNFEVEAFVYSCETGNEAREIFIEDQRECMQLSIKEWMKRPWWKRFLESLLRLFAPLL